MKIKFHVLGFMLWLPTSHGGVIDIPMAAEANAPISKKPHLHTTYTDLATDTVVQLFVEGYEGVTTTVDLNETFVAKHHYIGTKELALRSLDQRDVCNYFTSCGNYLYDNAAVLSFKAWTGAVSFCTTAATAIGNYYSANNYAHAFAVLDGVVGSLGLLIPGTVIGYYLNFRISKIDGSSTQDTCNANTGPVISSHASDAMYQFCMAVKYQAMADVTTRYLLGDMSTPDLYFDGSDGRQIVSSFNIAGVEFSTVAVCKDYGIWWRRDLNAAVVRGKQRQRAERRSLSSKLLE